MLAYKVAEVSNFLDFTEVHYRFTFLKILLLIAKEKLLK